MNRLSNWLLPLFAVASTLILSGCQSESAFDEPQLPIDALSINGSCEIYEIPNSQSSDWTIESYPDWVTPVSMSGDGTQPIKVYVESNSTSQSRSGEINISYKGKGTRSFSIDQSSEDAGFSLQRSYAAGWSFDVRTYMDARGLRGQIFNTQKIANADEDLYRNEESDMEQITFYYGENASELSQNIGAKLDLGIKYNAFSLDIHGTFGMEAVNNSQRVFSWIRGIYNLRHVYLNNLDYEDAADNGWFTADFAAERQKVIDAGGSDASIERLLERYGTHIVVSADLGGCYDYYYSFVKSDKHNSLNVEGAIKLAYAEKFNLEGNAKYKDDLKQMSEEKIERFSVKGGNALDLANQVYSGTINEAARKAWLNDLNTSQKWELLDFRLENISTLFPWKIAEKIDDYMARLYYKDVPLTRSNKK